MFKNQQKLLNTILEELHEEYLFLGNDKNNDEELNKYFEFYLKKGVQEYFETCRKAH